MYRGVITNRRHLFSRTVHFLVRTVSEHKAVSSDFQIVNKRSSSLRCRHDVEILRFKDTERQSIQRFEFKFKVVPQLLRRIEEQTSCSLSSIVSFISENLMPKTKSQKGDSHGNISQERTSTSEKRKRILEDLDSQSQSSKKARTVKDSVKYCQYCGDDIAPSNKSHIHQKCSTTNSHRKERAIKIFKEIVGTFVVLSIAIHVNYLNGRPKDKEKERKREKKDFKSQELLEKVTALRNSGGGFLLVHLVGLAEGDCCFSFFHEFADEKLNKLIADGSQFDYVYQKKQLSEYKSCLEKSDKDALAKQVVKYTDFLVIHITAEKSLTTANLNSKDSLDTGVIDSTKLSVSNFLKRLRLSEESSKSFHNPGVDNAQDVVSKQLQESRHIQFKRYFPSKDMPVDVVSLILNNRLAEYASAFTKLADGGSFFFGVREKDITTHNYYSKKPVVECVPIEDANSFKKELKERLLQDLLVYDYHGKRLSTDFVSVELLPSCSGKKENCTKCDPSSHHYNVKVSFKQVKGIVFHGKVGPVAYKIVGEDVLSYTVEEWFKITLSEIDDAHKAKETCHC